MSSLHYYNATLADANGQEFHATIFWDNLKQGTLTDHMCPRTGPSQVGYPVWSVTATLSRSNLTALVAKVRRKAASMDLRVVKEEETKYAAKLSDGEEN